MLHQGEKPDMDAVQEEGSGIGPHRPGTKRNRAWWVRVLPLAACLGVGLIAILLIFLD